MAFDPIFKMSMQDAAGKYYSATLQGDATWVVAPTSTTPLYITLPQGWDETSVTWMRDPDYMGVFRSMSGNGGFAFSKDARAIVQSIRRSQGIQGFCRLKIWMIGTATPTYSVFYASDLDFKTYRDDMVQELLSIQTLDNGLFRDVQAFGDTKYNIPVWNYIFGTWLLNDSTWVWHDGIKLRYNASFISSATPTNLLVLPNGDLLPGYNHGSTSNGRHWLPSLQQYNIVQNNGTTTFIGNDILQPFLIQGNQSTANEDTFWTVNDSRPYSRAQYLIKNLLQPTVDVSVTINATINGDLTYPNFTIFSNQFLGFVLFEIGSDDHPVMSGGNMQYIDIYDLPLPTNGSPYLPPSSGVISFTKNVTLQYDKVYVLGIIYDDYVTGIGSSQVLQFTGGGFSDLQLTIASLYDSGVSGIPINAPAFPASPAAAFRLETLLQKITAYLPTRQTDGYGFPIPVATDYTAVSDFLSDPTVLVGDCCPNQILVTSSYCLHDLQGRSYVSMSLNELFDFCKKQLGCGLALENDPVTGERTVVRIENLSYFLDTATMILDLGYDVADLEIEQMTEGVGANLKLGYSKADTNSDFAVDPFATELFFNTPASTVAGTMDYQEANILTEQYAIEKIRAQQVSQPIGTSYDPSSPSGDNETVALYCLPSPTIPIFTHQVETPEGFAYDTAFFQLTQRNGVNLPAAQSTDPSAATNPYIHGMYYPDTAYNLELSPCRALKRDLGGMLHSVLDNMDSDYLIFRNTTVMQYNNEVLALSGIESNLEIGAGAAPITEFKDIQIGTLPAQLYKPIRIKVKSKYPINMYQILNNNPNGYIRFFWKEKGYAVTEYKGFLMKATQAAGTAQATVFELLATPDMVI